MKESNIDMIAHLLRESKIESQNKPIVFLGAGMSATGGIPLANAIAKDILDKYSKNPKVKSLDKADHTYSKLMKCLTPSERNKLLNKYIEEAKVNAGYLYLANLIKQGYVDYVLTTNFDNLILRAMAMYNLFPAQYDLSMLKSMPTAPIEKQSVTFLHGTYRGLMMLNTPEEMESVIEPCTNLLNRIQENRTWIVVGYSGEDPLLQRIASLTSFTNNLYWVTYKDSEPSQRVKNELLDKPNTNAYVVKGCDADNFFMRLHAELNLGTPDILDNPFTSLLHTMDSIIENEEINTRLEINKRMIRDAIKRYEENVTPKGYTKSKKEIDLLIKEVIKYYTESSFEENQDRIEDIRQEAILLNNENLNEELSSLYSSQSLNLFLKDNSKEATDIALKMPIPNYSWIAFCYDELNDTPNTLKYLELLFKENPKEANDMNTGRGTWHCASDPRFIALLNKYNKIYEEEEQKKKSKAKPNNKKQKPQ